MKARYDLSIEYYDYTQERMKFERFEYYRLSSVARVLHARLRGSLTAMGLMPSFDDAPADNAKKHDPQKRLCRCSACQANRVSEHMRWNVYMRTGGYRLGERRDRALTHNNLIPFDRLDPVEQAKDCNCTVLGAENPPSCV